MVDDIVFDPAEFILETVAITPGKIIGFSQDGSAYDFSQMAESITIFIS